LYTVQGTQVKQKAATEIWSRTICTVHTNHIEDRHRNMEQKTIVQSSQMEPKTVIERWSRRQLYSVPKWNRKQGQKNGAEDNCTVLRCAQMEQKTGAERWSRRPLYNAHLRNRKQLQKDGAEDNCTVYPNGTENIAIVSVPQWNRKQGRKKERKTIVLYNVLKWNRKQGQKNGAEDNCTVYSVPKWNRKQGKKNGVEENCPDIIRLLLLNQFNSPNFLYNYINHAHDIYDDVNYRRCHWFSHLPPPTPSFHG
jgi:hypothetical protein